MKYLKIFIWRLKGISYFGKAFKVENSFYILKGYPEAS